MSNWQSETPNQPQKSKRVSNTECLLGFYCCAVAILSAQEDFRSVRSRLQEIVEEEGHILLLYPKFHRGLNWIEYYWGRCKCKHFNYNTDICCCVTRGGRGGRAGSISLKSALHGRGGLWGKSPGPGSSLKEQEGFRVPRQARARPSNTSIRCCRTSGSPRRFWCF